MKSQRDPHLLTKCGQQQMLNRAPQQMAIIKNVIAMNLGDRGYNGSKGRTLSLSLCVAFRGEAVEADAANTQWLIAVKLFACIINQKCHGGFFIQRLR